MNVYETLTLIESYYKGIKLVNTTTFNNDFEVDMNKANIYPLVNIDLQRAVSLDAVNRFVINFIIVQQRDIRPSLNKDNKRFGDNLVDNYNETFEIASSFLRRLRSNQDIDILSETDISFISKEYTNILDGVEFTLSIEVDNTTECYE